MHRAIETRYAGYLFRSRLEARYAIFFDFLKIKWDYEPEGYELPSGCYLPDFWLVSNDDPAAGCWVEIKPVPPTEAERTRMRELCKATGKHGFIVWGTPGFDARIWAHDGKSVDLEDASFIWDFGDGRRFFEEAVEVARSARFGKGGRG